MRRMDYSSFNVLPKQKINSYHIKMEDECSIGNDETRIFILSNLASNKMNKVPCVLCKQYLTVFDRYPLIDGTFFLSPRQHNRTCVQVFFSMIRPSFCRPKGQTKPKIDWRAVDSPQKRTNEFAFFAFFVFPKFVCSFLGESTTPMPICFRFYLAFSYFHKYFWSTPKTFRISTK